MTKIQRNPAAENLLNQVEELCDVRIHACLQCRRCSNGCPVSADTASSPSRIIRDLQLGAGEELLSREIVWTCASCGTCFSRCPMGINMGEVMDALRVLAVRRGAQKPEGNMPLMNRALLNTIAAYGRTYDLGAMIRYKLGTATYTRDAEKVPAMLLKGKIALLPPRGADKDIVKNIFRQAGKAKG